MLKHRSNLESSINQICTFLRKPHKTTAQAQNQYMQFFCDEKPLGLPAHIKDLSPNEGWEKHIRITNIQLMEVETQIKL